MEKEEEEQTKKKPLEMDWNKIFSKKDNGPPPEVRVVPKEELTEAELEMITTSSYHQLVEKIVRLRSQLDTLGPKLPDKGEKIRRSLRICEEELERRKQFQPIKEADREESKQSRSSCSLGASNGFSSETPSSQAKSQSKFTVAFSNSLEDKPDLSTRITVNQYKKLSYVGRGDHQDTKSNGTSFSKGKRERKALSRQSPFRCSGDSICAGNERRSLFSAKKTIETQRFYQSHQEEKSSSRSSKRRKASPVQASSWSRMAKRDHAADVAKQRETVVLLDEEDCQLTGTAHQENESNQRMVAKIYYPSRDDPECVELHYSDIKCLTPEVYLSSPIMNFYIRYLHRPVSASGRSRSHYHFFNTYFYDKIKEAVSCRENDKDTFFIKFRRWWKGVNIFEKAYILLPIHENYHWSLVIICLPNKEDESGPIILHLDSLGCHNSSLIFKNVSSFLSKEWKYLNQNDAPPNLPIADKIWRHLPRRIDEKKITVPQQKNDYDCGIFVLFFMERFLDQVPERLRKKDLDMFGRQWFKPEEASSLRKRIKDLLEEEFESARLKSESQEASSSDDSDGCTNIIDSHQN